jgi:vacuolar-type H+-ATPase subunit C/Vma6
MENYLVVRSHGLKLHLIKPDDYEKLLKSEDPINTLAALGYDDVMNIYGRSWPEVLKAVYAKLVEKVRPLMVDESYRKLLTAFLDRLEAANCKIKLRELMGERTRPVLYYPYSHYLDLEPLSKASDVHEYVSLLSETPYGLKLRYALEVYEKTGITSILEASIDFSYCNYYLEIAKGTAFEKFVKMEKEVYKVYWGELFDMLGKTTKSVTFDFLKIEPNGLSMQFSALKDFLIKLKIMAKEESLDMSYVYAYLISCWIEATNIEKILISKRLNIESKMVRDMLLHYPLCFE